MSEAIELDAIMTRLGREWRVLVNRTIVYEGDSAGAKNVKETLEQFAAAVRAEERDACLADCAAVARESSSIGRSCGADECHARIMDRAAAGGQGGGGHG